MEDASFRFHPFRWLVIGVAVMLLLIGAALFLRILFPAVIGYPMGHGFPIAWFWGLVLLILVLWVLSWIIRGAFWMVGGPGYRGHAAWGYDSAEEIARVRYARGELTREQYEQIRRDLE